MEGTPLRRERVLRRATVALAALLSLVALVQALHRAEKGQNALLKWRPVYEALERGEPIYGRAGEREGYPTLPLSILLFRPFLAPGPVLGPLVWAAFKLGLAWWMVLASMRLAAGRARDFPAAGALVVLLLSFRVLLSDVLHGNVNLAVAATIFGAGLCFARGRELAAGLLAALGAVLKVTPALFAVYFAWKKSPRALAGMLLGVLLFALVVPSLWLGPRETLAQSAAWWQQMVAPYLAGSAPTLRQSEHINQSLFGVLTRLCSDAVAIEADPPERMHDVRVTLVALSPPALRAVHALAALALVAALLWAARVPPSQRRGAGTLGELAMLALAMVFLSERSWKQHYVTLFLPLVFLVGDAFARAHRGERPWASAGALVATAVLIGLSGSGVLGHHGSNLAEAFGSFFAAGLCLYAACAVALARGRRGSGLAGSGAPP